MSSIASLRLKGAALPRRVQSASKPICGSLAVIGAPGGDEFGAFQRSAEARHMPGYLASAVLRRRLALPTEK